MTDKVIKGTIKTAGTATGSLIGSGGGAAIGTAICPGIGTAVGYLAGASSSGIIGYKVTSKLLD